MTTKHSIEFRGDHIFINHPEGYYINREDSLNIRLELAEICEQYQCWRVLREGKFFSRKMSWRDVHDAAVDIAQMIPNLKLAHCFDEYHEDQLLQFLSQTAQAHGIQIGFFADCDQAREWLGVKSN